MNILQENQLKMALVEFLKKYHPKDHDNFRIIAYGFGMYREMAKHHETVGHDDMNAIKDHLLSKESFRKYCLFLNNLIYASRMMGFNNKLYFLI